jgi:hypothetical protein
LTPWSGSPNTVLLGEGPQCCLTHGPDNGSRGYDGGAIEFTNTTASSVTLDSVTVDFGGGSSPSHFDLWGGGSSSTLPQAVPPGGQVVMTMTNSFDFDTSDLLGEACHVNSGVVPVVHVSVNGEVTDYRDDHQILNSDGADLASCPTDISEAQPFATVTPGDQQAAAPIDDVMPTQTGSAVVGRVLSGLPGGWNASPPPSLTSQWMSCDTTGANCSPISGATSATYRPAPSDVGAALRFEITAANASGTVTRDSSPTAVVQSGPAVAQLGDTSTGFTSVYAPNTTELNANSTVHPSAPGTTNDFEFFARGAGGTQTFTPKIYSETGGVRQALLATGATVTVPEGADGQWYVANLPGLQLQAGMGYQLALDPSGTGSTYVGADTSSGPMSFFLDYTP